MFRTIFISAAITTALASAVPILAQQDGQGDYTTQGGQKNSQGVMQDAESWDHEPGRESRNPGPDISEEAEPQREGSREGMTQDAESWDHKPGRESRNPGPDIQGEAEAQLERSREGVPQDAESWDPGAGPTPGRENQNPGADLGSENEP